MRNIDQYVATYLQDDYDFEKYEVEYRRRKILEVLDKVAPRRVLEIGCAMEPLFAYVPEGQYERWVTIEPGELFYQRACQLARSRAKVCLLQDFFAEGNGSVEKCLFEGGKFDMIICASLLQEVEDCQGLLHTLYAVCDIDTWVLVNVPNAHSLHRMLGLRSAMITDEHELTERNQSLQQQRVFDGEVLKRNMSEAGFEVHEIFSAFIKPFTHSQMSQAMKTGIINDRILDGLYALSKDLPNFGAELYALAKVKKSRYGL